MLLANAGSKNEVSKAALRTFHCSLQNRQETSIRSYMTWAKVHAGRLCRAGREAVEEFAGVRIFIR
jgi:hypothetical protein